MAGPESGGEQLKVFVSYSRADIGFADQLVLALEDKGFDPILDRHDIDAAEKWRERLGGLIFSCDTVVFVLTETSAGSPICAWEVEEAVRLGKRTIPVVPRPVEGVKPPPALGDLNWIHFFETPAIPGSGFYDGVKRLDRALRVDLSWLREGTRLSERAAEWRQASATRRPNDHLLQGTALEEAEAWLSRAPASASISDLVRDYLAASRDVETRRRAEAAAQIAEREGALKEKEEAVAQRAKADRRAQLATRIGLAVALVLIGVAAFGNWFAARATAQASANRSALFARESAALTADVDRPAAMLLAVAGDPAAQRGWAERVFDGQGYEPARHALDTAATHNRVERLWDLGEGVIVTSVAWSQDGKKVAVAGSDGKARVFAASGGPPLATFDHGSAPVFSVAFSPDGARVLTGTGDGKARVFASSGGAPLATFDHGGALVFSAAFSPDGARVLTGAYDGKARVFASSGGPALATFEGGNSVVFSADGGRVLTGAFDGKARLFAASGGPALAIFDHGDTSVAAVAFSPDGAFVLTGADDGKAQVFASSGAAPLATFDHGDAPVYSVAFSSDGARVLTGARDGKARIWAVPRIVLAPATEQVRIACATLRSIGYTRFTDADLQRFPILQDAPREPCAGVK